MRPLKQEGSEGSAVYSATLSVCYLSKSAHDDIVVGAQSRLIQTINNYCFHGSGAWLLNNLDRWYGVPIHTDRVSLANGSIHPDYRGTHC